MTDEDRDHHEKRGTTNSHQNPSNPASSSRNSNSSGPQPKNKSNNNNENNASSPSLASRIQSSASGLARNVFNTPAPSAELAHTLTSGSNGKAASASAPASSASSSLSPAELSSSGSSSAAGRHRNQPSSESFREPAAQGQTGGGFELPPLTEEEFQQHAYDHDRGLVGSSNSHGIEKGKGKAAENNSNLTDDPSSTFTAAWERSTTTTTSTTTTSYNQHQHQHYHHHHQQQEPDGEEVISLLTSRTFDPEFPPTADEPFEPIETDLSHAQLTPAEIQILDSFRRHFPHEQPAQPAQQKQHKLTSLSLVPDIESILDYAPSPSTTTGLESDPTTLRDTVLARLPGSGDWVDLEERYHDEVWGYLRPALEAAQKEIEETKGSSDGGEGMMGQEGPAVRRLRMILGHM